MKTLPNEIQHLFTKQRVFNDKNKVNIKEFKPFVQKISKEEVLFMYDHISKKYGKNFTIDFIKRIPEEKIIYFRATFKIGEFSGKGMILFDEETFEELFNNLERLIRLEEQKKIQELI